MMRYDKSRAFVLRRGICCIPLLELEADYKNSYELLEILSVLTSDY